MADLDMDGLTLEIYMKLMQKAREQCLHVIFEELHSMRKKTAGYVALQRIMAKIEELPIG